MKHKTKGKMRKSFNNKLQRRAYPKVLRKLTLTCEERGILFIKVPPDIQVSDVAVAESFVSQIAK